MVPAMHGDRHRIRLLGGGKAEGDGQHDGVAVRHHRGAHCLFRIMSVRHVDIVRQRGTGEVRADGCDVDEMMRHAETFCAVGCEIQLLLVALAVIERDKSEKFMFRRDFVRKRNGVQSAGADDDGFHTLGSLVLTGWAATGLRGRL